MKKLLPVGWVMGLAFLFSMIPGATALANSLEDMHIEVELQEDGSAVVTEFREMDMDEGTELYISLDNMQDSELLDFSVAGFEEETDWDLDASREEKAGKYGVVETGSGLELIWGIGDYGNNSYEVTYTLSNLVRELEDGQSLLWNFDTFSSIEAENFTLQVTGPEPFTQEDVKFWGFGFEGDIQLVNGAIQWEATEVVDSNNDATVLLQFPAGTFNTQVSIDQTLEEQRVQAQEQPSLEEESSEEMGPVGIGLVVLAFAGGATAIGAGATYTIKLNKAKKEAGEIPDGAALIVENEGKLLKEIPYTGQDLPGIAYLLQNMYIGFFEDYFNAYLIKWEMEERIAIHTDKKKPGLIEILNFSEESDKYPRPFSEIVRGIKKNQLDTYETGLWTMLLDASDETGKVSDKGIRDWAKDHAKDVEEFQNYLLDYSKAYLEHNGYIVLKEIEVWGRQHEIVTLTDKGSTLTARLVQFDNYLVEAEVDWFEEGESNLSFTDLLFWSVLFSRRDDITEQFDMLYDEEEYYANPTYVGNYYWYWYGMTGFQDKWNDGLTRGGFHSQNAAMYSGSSGSSGSGGATSFGGGGGAGGGGGGGAR